MARDGFEAVQHARHKGGWNLLFLDLGRRARRDVLLSAGVARLECIAFYGIALSTVECVVRHSEQTMTLAENILSLLCWIERSCLLSAPEERTKTNLECEADHILRNLERPTDDCPQPGIIRFFNQGALILYQYGQLDRALQVCEAGIALCLTCFEATQNQKWITELLQPYANIARLCGIRGQTSEALSRFRALFLFVRGDEDLPLLDRLSIPATLSPACQDGGKSATRIFTNSYAGDSIRACLLNEDLPLLEQFLHQCHTDGIDATSAARYLIEGEARYWLLMRKLSLAAEKSLALWTLLKREPVPDPAVLCLLCDVYLAGGEVGLASSTAAKALSYCDQVAEHGASERSLKRALYQLALRFLLCGDTLTAAATSLRSVEFAQSLGDESASIRLACLTNQIVPNKPSEPSLRNESVSSLRLLASKTHYRLDQTLAYLALDALEEDDSKAPFSRSHFKQKALPLISLIGEADAQRIREVFFHRFGEERTPPETETKSEINVSTTIGRTYEALIEYASCAVHS